MPVDGVADRALVDTSDLPEGFEAAEIDPADRWAQVVTTASDLQSLRPDCGEELDAITTTLGAVPPDAAGRAFRHDDGREIVQFTGVTTPEAGAALIQRIAELNSRCDTYKLQMPERASLAMTVSPLDLGDAATGWETTMLSDHLRWKQQYLATSIDGVVTFFTVGGGDITGEPPLSEAELTDLVAAAIERSEAAVNQ
jgi:hypothetical protein